MSDKKDAVAATAEGFVDEKEEEQAEKDKMAKEAELKKNEPPPTVIDTRLLKTGDYEIHVFLEETRGLVHPSDSS